MRCQSRLGNCFQRCGNTRQPYLYKLEVLFAKYAFQYLVQPVLRAIINSNNLCQHRFGVARRDGMSRGGKAYA